MEVWIQLKKSNASLERVISTCTCMIASYTVNSSLEVLRLFACMCLQCTPCSLDLNYMYMLDCLFVNMYSNSKGCLTLGT